MEKELLEQIGDDQDTIIIDAGDDRDTISMDADDVRNPAAIDDTVNGGLVSGGDEILEEEKTKAYEDVQTLYRVDTNRKEISEERLAVKSPRCGLYTLLQLLTPVIGTAIGITGAITMCAATALNAAGYPEKELHDVLEYNVNVLKFATKHGQEDFVSTGITIMLIMALVFLACVIGLCVMTGRFNRDETGRPVLNWFDRLWSEFHLAGLACAATGAVFTARPIAVIALLDTKFGFIDLSRKYTTITADNYVYGMKNDVAFWYCAAGMALCIWIALVCFVTLVKKIKARELIHASLLGKILLFLGWGASHAGRGAVKAGKGLSKAGRGIAKAGKDIAGRNKNAVRSFTIPSDSDRRAARKLMLKYSLLACLLIGLPAAFIIATGEYGTMLILTLIVMAVAVVFIVRKVGKLAEIRAGVIEVKSGNLGHKITVKTDDYGPVTDLDKFASDINHISEATNAAVQNEIKNQRLKTDLISNVSHDLKTPLTSMISYLDIIEKEGLDSSDAPQHLAIVREKTDRLKTLTEELFEAAKASSGNIPCEIADIDAAALIDQSLAEMGDRLAKKDLDIRKSIKAGSTMVRADGKLLYRVFENLLSNISKYALEGSRVYIDVTEPPGLPGRLLIEVKNISKDELNISPEELMERFTRGDSSRNTEGSGLGLAIAKDLTTLMGGVFDIKIDGDMFKASILLNKAN